MGPGEFRGLAGRWVRADSSFTFDFRLRHTRTNTLIATGYTTHVAIDEAFRPMPVPEEYRRTIGRFEGWEA